MERLSNLVAPGVATQKDVKTLLDYAKANNFAYPAVNIIGSHSINAALAAAKEVNSPIIIQLSHGGGNEIARLPVTMQYKRWLSGNVTGNVNGVPTRQRDF